MPAPNIKRVNICFPKDDTTTLTIIDQVRGNQSRSQAIHRILEYVCSSGRDVVKGAIADRHHTTPQDPTSSV